MEIWIPVIVAVIGLAASLFGAGGIVMHFINNNMAAVFEGADSLSNQSAKWSDIPPFFVASLLFALFILMPLFNKKKEEIPLIAES